VTTAQSKGPPANDGPGRIGQLFSVYSTSTLVDDQMELLEHEATLNQSSSAFWAAGFNIDGKRYGSPYSPDSINNPYGAGNPYRADSPTNPYGTGLEILGSDDSDPY
jgi:hypothetical protein